MHSAKEHVQWQYQWLCCIGTLTTLTASLTTSAHLLQNTWWQGLRCISSTTTRTASLTASVQL